MKTKIRILTASLVVMCLAMFIGCDAKNERIKQLEAENEGLKKEIAQLKGGDAKKDGGGKKDGDGGDTKKEGGKDTKDAKTLKIGDEVFFKYSTWVVIKAEDKGKTIASNDKFVEDATSSDGKFILIQFKVTNLSNKQKYLPKDPPDVIDSKGREFKCMHERQSRAYIPKGARTIDGAIPASLSREFYDVWWVPADATGLKVQIRDLSSDSSLPNYKLVDLGF